MGPFGKLEDIAPGEETHDGSVVESKETQVENLRLNIDSDNRATEIMRKELKEDGVSMLRRQIEILEQLNGKEDLHSPLRENLRAGETKLPTGVLFHNVRPLTPEVIASIASLGIVSGELVGIPEDGETHGCADFWRVPEDMSLAEYLTYSKEKDPRTNELRKERIRGLTFIVDPNAEGMDELLEHDGYSNQEMRSFIRKLPGRTAEDTAAILGGVPRGSIAGILVSDTVLAVEGMLQQIRDQFPDIPILNHDGVLQG